MCIGKSNFLILQILTDLRDHLRKNMPIKCLPSIVQFMYLIFTNVFLIYDRKYNHQFRVNQNKKI